MSKKVAMVIAFKNFKDQEYFVPKKIFEDAEAEVKTISNKIGQASGSDSGSVPVDFLLENFDPVDFDAVIFVGGAGCLQNLDNENSYKIIKETISQDKILAAICVSPVILAKAGILKGKRATVWSSALNTSPIKILEENGAIYTAKSVVQDKKIVTANGPAATEEFSRVILETFML